MKADWMNLDVDILNRLYEAKEKELDAAVMRGSSWDEVRIKRQALTEISAALNEKLQNQDPSRP